VVSATLSLRSFVDAWPHCQHVADFLARFAASDRFDPEQLTTRLATYLHEVLELVFRSHGDPEQAGAGDLVIAIGRRGDRLELDVVVPVDAVAGKHLRRSVRPVGGADPTAAYRAGFVAAVRGEGDGAGLLELVALHGIAVAVADAGDIITLTLTVPHE
jgi:hypothetical protein